MIHRSPQQEKEDAFDKWSDALETKYPDIFSQPCYSCNRLVDKDGVCLSCKGTKVVRACAFERIGRGWWSIVERICEEIHKFNVNYNDEENPIRATQIKEKFAGLRFYTNFTREINGVSIHKIISDLESESSRTCETCGEPIEEPDDDNGWWRAICPTCKYKMKVLNIDPEKL